MTRRLLADPGLRGYLTGSVLQLIVMPTEQCNFRCPYCFESLEGGRMPKSIVSGIKKLLERRAAGLRWLSIEWFGGEPLLAADIVEEVQEHALALARRHPGIRLQSSMTTNGYLLRPERFSSLLALGVREYQIAFDGPRVVHDGRRSLAGGQGTFDRIWRNLEAARKSDRSFEILVRLQLDRETRAGLREFVDLYASTFDDDPRFTLAFAPLSCLKDPEDASSYLDGSELRSVMQEVGRYAGSLGVRPYRPDSKPDVCHASRANSFIVRSDGTLAKCAVALSHPENDVGRLYEDGHVEIDERRMSRWMRGLWSGDEIELSCPMIGYADGPRRREE